ncbi:hypothetical protein EDC04DRAFT_2606154 [Pisolithus marmoratus]|nr:hypothetical protein EDC04DRAFT_2606154 [Pisolithus marmoratus]
MSKEFAHPNFWAAGVGHNWYILGFWNVFGNPTNECILHAAIKKECSAVQNKFHMLHWWRREDMHDTGRTHMDSSEQIQMRRSWIRFKSQVSVAPGMPHMHYYGRVHQYLMGLGATEESGIKSCKEGATVEADMDTSSEGGDAKRSPVGRGVLVQPRELELPGWGQECTHQEWRNNIPSTLAWNSICLICGGTSIIVLDFNEIIIQDQEHFGRNSGSILNPLPSMYMEPPETVPATGYPLMGQWSRKSSMANALLQPTHSSSDQLLASGSTEDLLGKDF